MTEILNMVINQDNVAKTTSLKVAEVFEKEHAKIIRKIEQIVEEMADFSNDAKNGLVKNKSYSHISQPQQQLYYLYILLLYFIC